MAIDMNQGVDLKDLGLKIKALFAKDSDIFGDKLVIFSAVAVLVTSLLVYLIVGISDNQSIYDEANGRNNNALVKLINIEKKLQKTFDSNESYFKQLERSPKTKSELSSSITSLVSQYSLKLKSIDLNATGGKNEIGGVKLVVNGSYLNLIRFSSEMNKLLAASKLSDLIINKTTNDSSLDMKLSIIFSPPPASLPRPVIKKAVKLLEPDTFNLRVMTQQSIFDDLIGLFVSSVNAEETALVAKVKINGLSLFQQAHSNARTQGLIKFKFTNKAGQTKEYLTGLKPTNEPLTIENEVKQVELAEIAPVKQAESLPELVTPELVTPELVTPALVAKVKINSPKDKNIKRHKENPKKYFQKQKPYVNANSKEMAIFKNGKKNGKEKYELAGFVENPSVNDPFAQKEETETETETEAQSLRDPFAPPGSSSSPRVNRGGDGASNPEEQYYLSGVLTSEMTELCVVITPMGESKIYHIGDKITEKISVTGIFSNAIMINASNKKILIGDEIR